MNRETDLSTPIIGITLRNGNVVQCYPQPLKEINMSRTRSEIDEDERYFVENAHFLLANASRIMSDSRMFLSDSRVYNGTALTGPLKPACLGAYLEWWIYDRKTSLDRNGNPIWLISGNGQPGAHTSKVVTPSNEAKYLILQGATIFQDVLHSFTEATSPYTEAMTSCQTYTLREVVEILKGVKDNKASEESLQRIAIEQLENCIDRQSQQLREEERRNLELKGKIQLLLFQKYRKELTHFLTQCVSMEEKVRALRSEMEELEYERFSRTHDIISNSDDRTGVSIQHREVRKNFRKAQAELQHYQLVGLRDLIGEDAEWFTRFSIQHMIEENPTTVWSYDPGYDPEAWE